jgi:hypothetical protein
MLLAVLLDPTLGYRELDAMVICTLLTAVGAFVGTHAHAPGRQPTA